MLMRCVGQASETCASRLCVMSHAFSLALCHSRSSQALLPLVPWSRPCFRFCQVQFFASSLCCFCRLGYFWIELFFVCPQACDAAIVTSGSVVFELLRAKLPMAVVYRGHFLTELIAKQR